MSKSSTRDLIERAIENYLVPLTPGVISPVVKFHLAAPSKPATVKLVATVDGLTFGAITCQLTRAGIFVKDVERAIPAHAVTGVLNTIDVTLPNIEVRYPGKIATHLVSDNTTTIKLQFNHSVLATIKAALSGKTSWL